MRTLHLQERQQSPAFSSSQPGLTEGPRGTPPGLEGLCKEGDKVAQASQRGTVYIPRLRRAAELSNTLFLH